MRPETRAKIVAYFRENPIVKDKSHKTLFKEIGISNQCLYNALAELEFENLIRIEHPSMRECKIYYWKDATDETGN